MFTILRKLLVLHNKTKRNRRWVAHLTRNVEVLDSNLGPETIS
jgi:hypothetical protein